MATPNPKTIHLFKPDLKFMDFHRITSRYVSTTTLNEKSKKDLMIRIHDYVFPVQEAIKKYPLGKVKQKPKTYNEIETGLKETLRRVKISLALNNKNSKLFVGYWKFLADVLQEDAALLKDEQLQSTMKEFEKNALTLKTKK